VEVGAQIGGIDEYEKGIRLFAGCRGARDHVNRDALIE
jgi:hypothetical protein